MNREPDIAALQDVQSRLAFLSHAYRQADKFEIAQHLSDAGSRVGKALRKLELSKQGANEL